MLVFRAVRFADLPAIEHLAVTAGNSMTTLPNNRDHLEQLINNTYQSLKSTASAPTKESYHFVIEDSLQNKVLGIAGIEACVGFTSPFYHYKCHQSEHYSEELQINNSIETLSLSQDYEGTSRLYTFFLTPDIESGQQRELALPLLSLSRLMFIGQQPKRFQQKVVLELQGIVDEKNESPFWQALGQHFFNMDFQRANYLTGINAKGFIADLMPKSALYVPLLQQSAQRAIGQLRPDMTKAKQLLEHEGFHTQGYISIFDGGPTLECNIDNITSISTQFKSCVQITDSPSTNNNKVLISNNKTKDFRSIIGAIDVNSNTSTKVIEVTPDQAHALCVDDGEAVFILPLKDIG